MTDTPATYTFPFIVEHRQEDRTLDGSFRPSARLILTPALRTSGLWGMLPPEDLQTLVLTLTFVAPNGWCRPTLLEMAEAIRVFQAKARTRVERLARREWEGQPLLTRLPRPDGLDAYAPGRQVVGRQEASLPPAQAQAALPPPVAGKEAVIAQSRARYTKTREEVESQIATMMGWVPPDFAGDDPAVAEDKRRAFKAMTDARMPKDQALDLLAHFDLGDVERQISWLPSRNAKNPARFLAAAIEGSYDMPVNLRREVSTEADMDTQKDEQ